ncbi:tetratricopeptide repeat protein [Sphingosinicella sp. LHD-64]|uniref:tetratricopeptide repeat protein n=1 Tax=Sphingosinicella sp. LHD-64 TaxID=3072139 RepID=UPI0028107C45|nr:tetratricopeptide repeat protein [Sphingosinicella sp. LHD-64]MDQ8757655.1 tetratricopeptide repeat protein [Sphingosinicella sp. LHD-64]
MASNTPSGRRISPATIALAAAAILAVAAIAIALFRSGGTNEAVATSNNMAAAAQAPGSVEDMIAGLRERLRQDPDNHEGWFLLGLSYRDTGNFPGAEQAFRRAMELAPQNADYTAYLAETLLLQGGRNPPPEAERLFRRTLELQADNAQARYYLATMKDVRGDHQGAVNDLVALLREAPADAPWEAQVRQAVTTIAQTNNIDIEGRLPPARTPPASTATAAIPGPTREQMDAARAIPPGQQDEMVKGMVDRLAARLQQNPRDEQGWVRLMRSRMVLNDRPGATDALRRSLAAFQGDARTQGRLRQAAEELGVPNPS